MLATSSSKGLAGGPGDRALRAFAGRVAAKHGSNVAVADGPVVQSTVHQRFALGNAAALIRAAERPEQLADAIVMIAEPRAETSAKQMQRVQSDHEVLERARRWGGGGRVSTR